MPTFGIGIDRVLIHRVDAAYQRWGDRFAKEHITIFFGPGRHGPGNNLFFMVVDADRNRLELSAELEITPAGQAPGNWLKAPDRRRYTLLYSALSPAPRPLVPPFTITREGCT